MVTLSKQELRRHFLSLRSAQSGSITRKLLDIDCVKNAQSISSFISYSTEINTHPFIEACLKLKKSIAVPKVSGQSIQLYQISSLSECQPGLKNILEPPDTNLPVDPQNIDVFIVPGLAFDVRGYRLGYGRGYYDRLLAHTSASTIGVCYTDQLMYDLPHESHDLPVDMVVTDTISLFTNYKKSI